MTMTTIKKTVTTIAGGLIISGMLAGFTSAATPVTIIMDGVQAPYSDALPFVNGGSTMVPIRFVSEKLGAKVTWNNKTKTVGIVKGEKTISLTVGSSFADVNGTRTEVGAKTIQKNGTTMVPLRFVSEVLKADVNWDADSLTVKIFTPGKNLGELDAFGRKIRITDLPNNSSDYPYILVDQPNKMYEMKYRFVSNIKGKTASTLYKTDSTVSNSLYTKPWKINAEAYYKLLLNVDYRTIDNKWASDLYSHMNSANPTLLADIKKYVSWVKQNKIIIEGDLTAEPSMITDNVVFGYYMRSHYTIKFINFTTPKDLLFDSSYSNGYKIAKFQVGNRYEGFSDISLSTNVIGDTMQKVSPVAGLFALPDSIIWKTTN